MTENGFQKLFHNCTARHAAVLLCSVSSACDLLLWVTLQYLKSDRFMNASPISFLFVRKHIIFLLAQVAYW